MMNTILIHTFLRPYFGVFIGMALICMTPFAAHAQNGENKRVTDPVVEMQAAINEVLTTLKNHELLYKSNPQQLRDIVAKSALPNFNMTRMAQLALAKNWRTANTQQREMYVHEFQRYLIRSYTETLYVYRNSKPKMLGANINDNNENKATVKISVENDNDESVLLFLRLELTGASWKIVDVNVEGISLVITTRGVFEEEINRIGLDGFLKNLTEKNDNAEQN